MIKKFGAILLFVGIVVIGLVVYSVLQNRPVLKEVNKTADRSMSVDNDIVVGFSVGTLREDRWIKDSDLFVERIKELGATANLLFADNDIKKQLAQAENLILQGVNVLVVVPQDAEVAAAIVEKAHKAGVKVIAYDRLIKNCDLDYYISFDNVKVGELEAKGVLDKVSKGKFAYIGGSPADNNAFLLKEGSMRLLAPKVKSGDISLVLDSFAQDWKPEEAYKTMKSYLEANKTIDGVVAANDGTALGVIQALSEYGLAGKIPVSGQDAEVGACQRIVEGTQTITVYKPIKLLAYKAAEIAVAFARGQKLDANTKINNGKIDVLSYMLEPIAVTKENMDQTVIKDGFHSAAEVYKNVKAR
jgi:D-xylose transport system substrate-binding protein